MKTPIEVINEPAAGYELRWEKDEFGIVLKVPAGGREIEVRLEPLLYEAARLAVYIDTELIAEPFPITIGTPAQFEIARRGRSW